MVLNSEIISTFKNFLCGPVFNRFWHIHIHIHHSVLMGYTIYPIGEAYSISMQSETKYWYSFEFHFLAVDI